VYVSSQNPHNCCLVSKFVISKENNIVLYTVLDPWGCESISEATCLSFPVGVLGRELSYTCLSPVSYYQQVRRSKIYGYVFSTTTYTQ